MAQPRRDPTGPGVATAADIAQTAAMRRVRVLQAQVMFTCNNTCWFCLDRNEVDGEFHGGPPVVPLERIAKLLHQQAGLVDAVMFTHGEPTLHPELAAMLALARDLGFVHRGVVSNGRRLADMGLARRLCEAGANRWVLSIHGADAATHDASVGKSAFAEASRGLANLGALKEAFGLSLASSTVVSRLNLAQTAATVAYLAAAGVDQIVLNIVRPTGHAAKHFDRVVPRYSDVVAALRPLLAEQRDLLQRLVIEDIPLCAAGDFAPLLGVLESWVVPASDESAAAPRAKNALADLEAQPGPLQEGVTGDLRKRAACADCVHDRHCWGVWGRYVDAYGWEEFSPVSALSHLSGGSAFGQWAAVAASAAAVARLLPAGWSVQRWTLDDRRERLIIDLAGPSGALCAVLQPHGPGTAALHAVGNLGIAYQDRRALGADELSLLRALLTGLATPGPG